MRRKDSSKEQAILDAALHLIMKSGLSGLKMTELSKEVGIAIGTLYIYFEDKEALIRQLYVDILRKTSVDLLKSIKKSDPTKIKIQKISFNYLIDNILHPEHGAFFEQYFRSPFFLETDAQALAEQKLMQPIYDLVLQGQKEKIIKAIKVDLLVSLVCGMLNEVARQAYYEQRLISDDEWQAIFSVIWDGIKA